VKQRYSAKDLFLFACMVMSLVAVVIFRDEPKIPFILTALIIVLVAWGGQQRKEILPVLAIVIVVKVFETLLSYVLFEIDSLIYLMSVAMLDLILAFVMVHYHNDPALLKLFRVHPPHRHVPQVFFMSFLLALSSLLALALASEVIFYTLDPEFFAGEVPLIYSLAEPIRFALKFAFDLAIWSLLLNPAHWSLLHKIQLKFRKYL
jgi:hypothetical protein